MHYSIMGSYPTKVKEGDIINGVKVVSVHGPLPDDDEITVITIKKKVIIPEDLGEI